MVKFEIRETKPTWNVRVLVVRFKEYFIGSKHLCIFVLDTSIFYLIGNLLKEIIHIDHRQTNYVLWLCNNPAVHSSFVPELKYLIHSVKLFKNVYNLCPFWIEELNIGVHKIVVIVPENCFSFIQFCKFTVYFNRKLWKHWLKRYK